MKKMNPLKPRSILALIRLAGSSGFNILAPFLALWLHNYIGLSLAQTTGLVGCAIFLSRASAILTPLIFHFTDERISLFLCLWLFIFSCGAMYVVPAESLALWYVILSLFSFSYASINIYLKTLTVSNVPPGAQMNAFIYLRAGMNFGTALGPIIGGLFATNYLFLLPILCAAFQALSFLFLFRLPKTPCEKEHGPKEKHFIFKKPYPLFLPHINFKSLLHSIPKDFFLFLLASCFAWYAWAQFFRVLPTYSEGKLSADSITLLFTVNAIAVVVLHFPISYFMEKRMSVQKPAGNQLLYFATLLMALSMMCFHKIGTDINWLLFTGVVIFSLSQTILVPLLDTAVAELKGNIKSVWAFGVSTLFWGLGEAVGVMTGLSMLDQESAFLEDSFLSPYVVGLGVGFLALVFFVLSHPFVTRSSISFKNR